MYCLFDAATARRRERGDFPEAPSLVDFVVLVAGHPADVKLFIAQPELDAFPIMHVRQRVYERFMEGHPHEDAGLCFLVDTDGKILWFGWPLTAKALLQRIARDGFDRDELLSLNRAMLTTRRLLARLDADDLRKRDLPRVQRAVRAVLRRVPWDRPSVALWLHAAAMHGAGAVRQVAEAIDTSEFDGDMLIDLLVIARHLTHDLVPWETSQRWCYELLDRKPDSEGCRGLVAAHFEAMASSTRRRSRRR